MTTSISSETQKYWIDKRTKSIKQMLSDHNKRKEKEEHYE